MTQHLYPYKDKRPKLGEGVFLAPSSVVVGDVTLGDHVNIWYNATLRGDVHSIQVGDNTNIQDNAVCHVTTDRFGLSIGTNVTVGHSAILHGCTVHDYALVGMGAKVLDGSVVEKEAYVAAGALISAAARHTIELYRICFSIPSFPVRG